MSVYFALIYINNGRMIRLETSYRCRKCVKISILKLKVKLKDYSTCRPWSHTVLPPRTVEDFQHVKPQDW